MKQNGQGAVASQDAHTPLCKSEGLIAGTAVDAEPKLTYPTKTKNLYVLRPSPALPKGGSELKLLKPRCLKTAFPRKLLAV